MSATAPAPPRAIRPLAGRLVAMVIAVCASCALLALVVQGWQAWTDTESANWRAVQEITQGRLPALAGALWDIDTPTVQRQVDEIARHPQVAGVRLTTAGGQRFVAGRRLDKPADVELVVPHPAPGGTPLGRIDIVFNHRYVDELLLRSLLRTVLGIALLATLTAVLLIRFLRRELSLPLHRVAEHARRLDPGANAPPLQLQRPERDWQDDIDLVADAFNTMQASVRRHIGERDQALRTLAAERDALDATVRERTADLTRLNRFLAHVTQLSARLIDLPLAGYDDALRGALAELARELGAGACALAEADEGGVWRWRWSGGIRGALATEGAALPDGCADAIEASGADTLSQPHEALSCALGVPVLLLGRRAAADRGAGGHLLACIDAPAGALTDSHADQLRLVAEVLFGALTRWHGLQDLERTRQQLLQQSRSDPLTGLANRRAFDERKLDELRRARRSGAPLTVMMVDIDHFKRFNDRYGHAAGDDCLVRVAQTLHSLFQRPFDCVARMGGEEFALLLPGLPAAEVPAQAERVLQALAALAIGHADSPFGRVSVSVGSATITQHDDTPLAPAFDRLLHEADAALYRAKAAGRNTAVAVGAP